MALPPPCSPREGAPRSSAGPAGGIEALPVPAVTLPRAGPSVLPARTPPASIKAPALPSSGGGSPLSHPLGAGPGKPGDTFTRAVAAATSPWLLVPCFLERPRGGQAPPSKLAGSPGETPGVPQSRKPVNSLPSASRWAGLLRTGPRASASPAVGGFRNRGGEEPPVSQRRRQTRASVLPKAPSRALARMRRALLGLLA